MISNSLSLAALVAASTCTGLLAQTYPTSSTLSRGETQINADFVPVAVHGYNCWSIDAPKERIAAGPAGTVPTANVTYVAYVDTNASGDSEVRFRRSITGGLTWEAPVTLHTLNAAEVISSGATLAPDFHVVSSEHDVFVVYASNGHTLAAGDQAVFAVGSSDQGQTWTAPTLITTEFLNTLKDADEVACAISRNASGGASLNVVFEADTPSSGTEDLYYVQAEIQGGGMVVTVPEYRLNDANPLQSFDVDFTAIAADGPVIHVAWCDDRSGVENDYFSRTSINNGADWATQPEYRHTNLPTLSWAAPRRPRVAVDLPNVYTFMEHSQGGEDDVYMDWSLDVGASWFATGVIVNTQTVGSGGDIDDMMVTADDGRVAVVYVDDRLNGTNNNANNQAIVSVSNNGGLDFMNGTHVEVPLSLKDPNPIYGIEMAGDMIAVLYETASCGGGGGEDFALSLSADGGQTFTHYDVTNFGGCGQFPNGVDVDNPRLALTSNGDVSVVWQDDRLLSGSGGGNSVNNLWITGKRYPELIDNTATAQGLTFQNASPATQGDQVYVVLSLSGSPATIPLDSTGNTLNIGYDVFTEASVIIAETSSPAVNRDFVGANGSVQFPFFPNVGALFGLPIYAAAFTVTGGVAGTITDPILMQ